MRHLVPRTSLKRWILFGSPIVLALATGAASADVILLTPNLDNTLIVDQTGALSNGQGPHMYVGRTNQPVAAALRRAVLAFDLSPIPAGAVVTSAGLTLYCSLTVNPTARSTELRRLTASWGEGTSNAGTPGGTGAPSTAGDATWLHRLYPGVPWTTAGGDYSLATSASTSIAGTGGYTWGSTPEMVSDVQGWLDTPASNFGWILIGDELTAQSAKRVDSAENADPLHRPSLRVEYDDLTPALSTTWGRVKTLYR